MSVLTAVGYYSSPKTVSYGPLPQTIMVYDHTAPSTRYWAGPTTLDENDLLSVRGEERFHNPSNYGLVGLPIISEPWANFRLHFDKDCYQAAPLTSRQQLAIDRIVRTAEELPNGTMTWRYDFALNYLNLVYEPGFNSAFSQAVNIAALLFAECKTGKAEYFALAKAASKALILPISEGGLLNDEDGLTFFEELPAPKGLSPYILNAHIFSTNVLYAMANRANDNSFGDYARRGVETLIKLIPRYDDPKCIRYDLINANPPCNPDYDAYEAVLLDDLYEWSYDERVSKIAARWKERVIQSKKALQVP
ncbi:hypothetical protein JQ615_41430 [Bradyrhizobium jicamae]|uniref:D-glucuronyl C5-epimerase C-terminal domain-containing protein n=1 Tax=Bradyrhizobium jicamae TaxID=280332 RepID=A0ABS5FY92_9BRAD|nr:D-glucuronyl C5-epimerase family protein [Bradyrhizobium jicamae]MBR0801799.1 hypothetical protein [Bradyrhizobium jicamae]